MLLKRCLIKIKMYLLKKSLANSLTFPLQKIKKPLKIEVFLSLFSISYKYNLEIEDRTFKLAVPTTQPYYLTKYLGFFTQALSLIANIDI